MYVGQHAVGMAAKKTNYYSLFMEVCGDSCRSETRLPGFVQSHPRCVMRAAAMKLYFLFCQEFQQPAALFGGLWVWAV